ncbi:hypothetical protein OsJ_06284 [Oryza sativa Japonica Group]|uniref:Uncharacterized protein n=1 Tax=Oryza sativa subsp. japonica TaxID=39947 RepID=B9F520_ORYSJ|nr:hypothetical protein OsJ_06284 [Oryza sativa Japonica Group]
MELATGALPSVIAKLGDLLVGEYNLQKAVKGEIRFLQSELESMQGALAKVSATPADQLDPQDKIWARDLRELSFDIEDTIDAFVVRDIGNDNGDGEAKPRGISKLIDRSVGLFRKAKARHGIASEIMDIKSRVVEVHERRRRYEINIGAGGGDKTATIDPRLFTRYTDEKELVGIVSQTPDLKKLFMDIIYQLDKEKYKDLNEKPLDLDEVQLINELREFLQQKRYFIVMDDIWDISIWKMIKCALPDNDVGYKIITTTRISEVAEKAGGVYKLKHLSLNNSRRLLYGRIFGNCEDTEKYPDEELAEVSERILKKCAGVPLAIITMASLLACKARNKMEWYKVYNSVGTGLENSLDVKNMRKILSFSYYDLPPHLRTYLLYLSVFPEDYKIEKDRLIWMWVAEGFIQCGKQGRSLFELGESYFNDLVNRNMIQPIYDMYTDMVSECRVHDMVLDLICSLSSEENFVTILNGRDQGSLSYTIRRLSLQNGNEDHAMTSATRSLQQARTALVFPSATDLLRHLTSLCFDGFARVPDGIGSLTRLEHLAYVLIDCATVGILEELGNLTELRVLCIIFWDGWNDKLVGLLHKLQKIQRLSIDVCMNNVRKNMGGLDAWVAPRHLVALDTEKICWFSSLPAWMTNPSHVPNLRSLSIAVREIRQADVETLGRLPALRDLQLQVDHEELGIRGVVLVIGSAGSFACLVCCGLWGFVGPAVFRRGAMPRLRTLRSRFSVREAIAVAGAGDDGLDLGLGSLPSLQEVNVSLDCEGASEEEVNELKAALRRATKIHPNHPSISIDGEKEEEDTYLISIYHTWHIGCALGMVAVFHAAPHRVEAKHVDHSVLPSVPKAWCPKPLMVVAPANAGTYPVAIFLHGCNMVNSWKVACWAADERQGLAYVLGSVLNLPGVKPDLSRLALVA